MEENQLVTQPEVTGETQEFNTQQQAEGSEIQQEPPRIKVKYNHEEKDLSLEEAREYAQKGMNYDKVQEKYNALSSDPRLSLVDKLAHQAGMTTDEFIQAIEYQEFREQMPDVPDEVAQELMESRKFRETYLSEQAQKQKDMQLQSEISHFLEVYPDIQSKDIPDEVWHEVNSGKPLMDAYAKYENQILKNKLAEYETKLNIRSSNAQNAQASTGSVNGQGAILNQTLTPEMINEMTDAQRMARWSEIKKVLNMK